MNYTYRNIWLINFPVMMSILIEQLINITDAIFLGHVGEIELGASALAGIWYLAIYMLGFGFSLGLQVVIARRNGERNYPETGKTFFQGLLFLSVLAILLCTVSKIFSPHCSGQTDCIGGSICSSHRLSGLAYLGIAVFIPISCIAVFPCRYHTYEASEQGRTCSRNGQYTLQLAPYISF